MPSFKAIISGLSITSVLLLAGCTSDEEKIATKYQQDGKILTTYDEDLLKPKIHEEKSPDEMIEEMVKKELGIDTTVEYKKLGVSDKDSSLDFYNKIINDNKPLVNSPNIDNKLIDIINNNSEYAELEESSKNHLKEITNKFKKDVETVTKETEEKTNKKYEQELKKLYEKELQEAQDSVGKEIDKSDTYEGSSDSK